MQRRKEHRGSNHSFNVKEVVGKEGYVQFFVHPDAHWFLYTEVERRSGEGQLRVSKNRSFS